MRKIAGRCSKAQRPAILPWFLVFGWRASSRSSRAPCPSRPAAGLLLDAYAWARSSTKKHCPPHHMRGRHLQIVLSHTVFFDKPRTRVFERPC